MTILSLSAAAALSLGASAAADAPRAADLAPKAASHAGACDAIHAGTRTFDFAAREKQVASGDQRIEPLTPDQMTQEGNDIAASLHAFFGSKPGGDKTFYTVFKHPGLYKGQMQLGLELNQHGKLPPREREMVILRTAWLVRSPFEWGEHVTYGKRLGLTNEEIERIAQGSCAAGWNEHDRAVLRGVEELIGDFAVSDSTWATLGKTWSEAQLLELPGVVGSYTLTAMLYNSVRFGLLQGNQGFRQR